MSTYLRYKEIRFNAGARVIIAQADAIVKEYEAKGYKLTVRGLYYQLVSRGLTADWKTGHNTPKSYNRLKSIVGRGRNAGLISWTSIEDRNRSLRGISWVESPGEAIRKARNSYATDLWRGQDWRPEVWVEKEAQAGVVGRVCNELRVDYFPCKGYTSQSAAWEAGRRFADYVRRGQRPIVFHLGDHDPSGLDMTRDNRERLELYAGIPVTVVRLALNRDQIDRYNPPPNPAKFSDSRAEAYVAEHGSSSWELDALEPEVVASTIWDAVLRIRDPEKWDAALAEEAEDKDRLDIIADDL